MEPTNEQATSGDDTWLAQADPRLVAHYFTLGDCQLAEQCLERMGRQRVEYHFERFGLDPASCETTTPVKSTSFVPLETDGSEVVELVISTDLSEYLSAETKWDDLSWCERAKAYEWIELHHEIRMEMPLLSPEHRARFEEMLKVCKRPVPAYYPWFYMEIMYQTAAPEWEPQYAALGLRF